MDQRVEITTSPARLHITDSECISFLIDRAVENQYSIAVWRLPNEQTTHLILSRQQTTLNQGDNLEDMPSGFIFSPFDPEAARIFLKADMSFSFQDSKLKAPATELESSSTSWFQSELAKARGQAGRYYTSSYTPSSSEKANFIEVISSAMQEIEKGILEKIVPSRTAIEHLRPLFDVVQTFQRLCDQNPLALISFVSTPSAGSWMGASPELLVCVENQRIFKTIALAGTQAYQPGQNLKSVAWTQKDIEEQALVERYIISCFKKIRLREYEEHGPKTVVAGNVLHLKSEFKVDMQETNFPQLGSIMLRLLHPTSAVCGSPLIASMEFLSKHEGYQRQFYTGYLGPVNFNEHIQLFVNLRCAQLLDGQAILYAGAGITSDSIPEQEWIETEMKMNTLRNALAID